MTKSAIHKVFVWCILLGVSHCSLHAEKTIKSRKMEVSQPAQLLVFTSGVVAAMGAWCGVHAFGGNGLLAFGGAFFSGIMAMHMVAAPLYRRELVLHLSSLEVRLVCLHALDRDSLQEMLVDAKQLEKELAFHTTSKQNSERIAKVIEAVQIALKKSEHVAIAA